MASKDYLKGWLDHRAVVVRFFLQKAERAAQYPDISKIFTDWAQFFLAAKLPPVDVDFPEHKC